MSGVSSEATGSGLAALLVLGPDVCLCDWPLLSDLDLVYWAPSVCLSIWAGWAVSDLLS